MAIKHVILPLKNEIDYKFNITLQAVSYTIRLTYTETLNLYTMKVSDVNGVTLISGVGLVPNYPIALDYVISGLTGAFFLLPKATTTTEFYKTYPTSLADYYELSYIYNDTTI